MLNEIYSHYRIENQSLAKLRQALFIGLMHLDIYFYKKSSVAVEVHRQYHMLLD